MMISPCAPFRPPHLTHDPLGNKKVGDPLLRPGSNVMEEDGSLKVSPTCPMADNQTEEEEEEEDMLFPPSQSQTLSQPNEAILTQEANESCEASQSQPAKPMCFDSSLSIIPSVVEAPLEASESLNETGEISWPGDCNETNLQDLPSFDQSFSDVVVASCSALGGEKMSKSAEIKSNRTIYEASESFFDEIEAKAGPSKSEASLVHTTIHLETNEDESIIPAPDPELSGTPNWAAPPSTESSPMPFAVKSQKSGSSRRRGPRKQPVLPPKLHQPKARSKSSKKGDHPPSLSRQMPRKDRKTKKSSSSGKQMARQAVNSCAQTKAIKRASYSGSSLPTKARLLKLRKLRNVGTWVECCNTQCKKWRLLEEIKDPTCIPEVWTCGMNSDARYNRCVNPEMEHAKGSLIYVEASFSVGSLVWAKLDKYPWWPALVDDDPDTERYFWTEHPDSPKVTRYHVLFLNRLNMSVPRAWIKSDCLRKFGGSDQDLNSITGENKLHMQAPGASASLEARWNEAVMQANLVFKSGVTKRRKQYCFMSRFQGNWILPWDTVEIYPSFKLNEEASPMDLDAADLKAQDLPLKDQGADPEE